MSLHSYLPEQGNNDCVIIRFPATINYINAEAFVDQISKLKKPKQLIFNF
jgi:hypothetical protein